MVRWEAAIIDTFGATLGVLLGVGLDFALTKTLRRQGIHTIELPYQSFVIMAIRDHGGWSRGLDVPSPPSLTTQRAPGDCERMTGECVCDLLLCPARPLRRTVSV